MIISHKYKFIFLKPKKVAGTSIEIALSKFCGKNDIITDNFNYKNIDSDNFENLSNNNKDNFFYDHITPDKIIKKIGLEKWNEYFKFTIVRNPWDQVVSSFFWEKFTNIKKAKKITFKLICKNFFNINAYELLFKRFLNKLLLLLKKPLNLSEFNFFVLSSIKGYSNSKYYFKKKLIPICDYYIKYENLDNDFKELCDKIGIPYNNIPKTKDKVRKEKKHYSKYYNKFTKKIIKIIYKKEINYFKYKFERK